MKFNDGKTFSAYVRSNLHSGYITIYILVVTKPCPIGFILVRSHGLTS